MCIDMSMDLHPKTLVDTEEQSLGEWQVGKDVKHDLLWNCFFTDRPIVSSPHRPTTSMYKSAGTMGVAPCRTRTSLI